MARTGRPTSVWWWAAGKRWAVNVDGKRRTAPATIGQDDRQGAEQWAEGIGAVLDRETPLVGRQRGEGRVPLTVSVTLATVARLDAMVKERRARGEHVHRGQIVDELLGPASPGSGIDPGASNVRNPGR